MRILLEFLPQIGWLLLAVLPPLLVNAWGQQPFELPKAIVVRTLVWSLTALFLCKAILTRRPLLTTLRANPLLLPATSLAVVIAVTTATAANGHLSLWGSYERAQGAVMLITYLLLFCLAAAQFRRLARAVLVITWMVLASIPLVVIALLQTLGWRPLALVTDARSPVFATLGRANFLGAYLALCVPLTVALLVTARGRRLARLWSALLASQLLVIGLTLTRSAWIATAISLLLFAVLWWRPQLTLWHRRLAWGISGSLLLSGPLFVLWLGQRPLGSIAARLAIWRGTLRLIAQRPLLGYGADSLGVIFPRFYPPELVYYQGRDTFIDRAHNLVLDWTVTAGITGLLVYLFLLILFVIVIARALRRPLPSRKRALLSAILAAVVGNTANNLLSFDVTATATATWLLMGVAVALAAPPRLTKAPAAKWTLQKGVLVGLTIAAAAIAIWQLNARPLFADVAARSASRYAKAGNLAMALSAAEDAAARWPPEAAHHLALGRLYWQQALADPAQAEIWLAQAEGALLGARERRPGDPAIWLYTAQFYRGVALIFGSDTWNLAEDAFRQTLVLAPNDASAHAAFGRAFLEEGNAVAAAPLLRRAVWLDGSNGRVFLDLGAAELALGRGEVALADFREAVRLLPDSAQAHIALAEAYAQLGRSREALQAIAHALELDPRNARALALRQEIHGSP